MARSVKCLLFSYEDLFDPQHHDVLKVACSCNASTGVAETDGSLELTGQPAQDRWRTIEGDTKSAPTVFTAM